MHPEREFSAEYHLIDRVKLAFGKGWPGIIITKVKSKLNTCHHPPKKSPALFKEI